MAQDSRDSVLIDPRSMLLPERPAKGPAVEIDASPLYEVLLGLLELEYARNGWNRFAGKWFDALPAGASSRTVEALEGLGSGCWLWHSLLFLAWQQRADRQALDAVQFIERLRSMEPEYLFEFLLGGAGRSGTITSSLIQQAVLGEGKAQVRLVNALFPDDRTQAPSLRRFLGIAPQRLKDLLVRIIGDWYVDVVRGDERKLAIRLANEARTKRIIGNSSPNRLLRAAAIGIEYVPPRSVTRVVLIPSVVCRPSIVTIRFASTRMFFYPLDDEPADGDNALPSQLVKIHRALADSDRLRILRSLTVAQGTVEGLSRELGRPHDAIRMQLIVLRDAGLVSLRMNERRCTFAIRQNVPSVVFRTLQAFLPSAIRTSQRRGRS